MHVELASAPARQDYTQLPQNEGHNQEDPTTKTRFNRLVTRFRPRLNLKKDPESTTPTQTDPANRLTNNLPTTSREGASSSTAPPDAPATNTLDNLTEKEVELTENFVIDKNDYPDLKNEFSEHPFLASCRERRIDIVSKQLKAHPEFANQSFISGRSKSAITPLLLASYCGHLDVIKLLLESDADINAVDNNGWNILHFAAGYGHTEIVKFLEENKKVDINIVTKNGYNALHFGAANGHIETVKFLVGAKVDINAVDNNGWNILHFAAKYGHIEIIKYLVENENTTVDINAVTKNGWNILHLAAENGHIEIIKYLMENENTTVDINAVTKNGWNILHLAARYGHIEIIMYLVEYTTVDINAEIKDGWHALHLAAENGHIETVKFLVGAKVDINAEIKDGWHALHLAAENGHIETVMFLVGAKVDINAGNKDGYNALHLAAENGHIETVKFLVGAKVDINAVDKDGRNALHFAARFGNNKVIEFLCEKEIHYQKTAPSSGVFRATKSISHNLFGATPMYIAKQFRPASFPTFIERRFLSESKYNERQTKKERFDKCIKRLKDYRVSHNNHQTRQLNSIYTRIRLSGHNQRKVEATELRVIEEAENPAPSEATGERVPKASQY